MGITSASFSIDAMPYDSQNASQKGSETLVIRGAREHNLKNVSLELPRDALIVFTGISGSGKSSLAFDTIYAEGQRRYVESLSSYARQFLGQMDKPEVDFIEGLSPAISIDQKSASRNPRSTVGTITEIYDYLRLLYARIGRPHCHNCGRPIARQTPEQIVDQILELPEGTRFQVLAPVVKGRKGEFTGLFEDLARRGFVRARVDGEVKELSEKIRLDRYFQHDIDVIVDRLVLKEGIESRLTDSIETALKLAEGVAAIDLVDDKAEDIMFSQHFACIGVRDLVRRACAEELLVQLALRRVRALRWPRNPPRGRYRPRHQPRSVARRRCDRSVVGPDARVLRPAARLGRQDVQVQDRRPVQEAVEEGARHHPVRLRGRRDPRPLPEPLQPDPVLLDDVRGRHPVARATPGRDR